MILTSNAGTRELSRAERSLGFARKGLDEDEREEIVDRSLAYSFRPEFLARIDETIVFDHLSRRDAVRIAELRLGELAQRVRRTGPRVRFSGAVARWVAANGMDEAEGARGIDHLVRREIEAPMAEILLEAGRRRGFWIEVSIRRGRPPHRSCGLGRVRRLDPGAWLCSLDALDRHPPRPAPGPGPRAPERSRRREPGDERSGRAREGRADDRGRRAEPRAAAALRRRRGRPGTAGTLGPGQGPRRPGQRRRDRRRQRGAVAALERAGPPDPRRRRPRRAEVGDRAAPAVGGGVPRLPAPCRSSRRS